jgi:mannose-6-phosphate isomerase-like protein (cupin superfamily)
MKRSCLVLLTGILAGYALGNIKPIAILVAQSARENSGKLVDGEAMVFTNEQLEKMYPPADKAGQLPSGNPTTNLAWEPNYRLALMRRAHFDPPQKNEATGETMPYAGSEMHENKAQIYLMRGGTGSLGLGGKPMKERPGPIVDGQHGGSELTGARDVRVKAGDIVVIPPNTWHIARPDPGQTLTYALCHVESRRTIP